MANLDPCPICQENYNHPITSGFTSEEPCKLPCGHIFGTRCISNWYATTNAPTCPLCRFPQEYKKCKHLIPTRKVSDHPPLLTHESQRPDYCRIVCDVLREHLEVRRNVWEKAVEDAEWLLRSLWPTVGDDVEAVRAHRNFCLRKRSEERKITGSKITAHFAKFRDVRW